MSPTSIILSIVLAFLILSIILVCAYIIRFARAVIRERNAPNMNDNNDAAYYIVDRV